MSGRPNAPLLPPDRAAHLLEDVIFTRVVELIDLPRLYDLESMLALQIESLGASGASLQPPAAGAQTPEERSRAIAKAMVDRALLRVARTSRKWTRWSSPTRSEEACDICGSPCEQEQSTST